MDKLSFLLEALGQALYTHAKNAAEAEEALEAVEYLDDAGIFNA